MSLPAFRAAKVTISKLRYVRCRSDPANSDGFSQSYMGRGFRVGHPFPRSLTLLQPFQIKEILGTSDLSPRAATLVFREEREMPASSEPGLYSWEIGHRFSPTITASASHAPILGRDTMPPSRVEPAIATRAVAIAPTALLPIVKRGTLFHPVHDARVPVPIL